MALEMLMCKQQYLMFIVQPHVTSNFTLIPHLGRRLALPSPVILVPSQLYYKHRYTFLADRCGIWITRIN